MKKQKAFIFDLDGTLCNVQHRINHYGVDYDKFNSLCHLDPPNEDVVELCKQLLNIGYKIIFLTGRDEKYRKQTFDWIWEHILSNSNHLLSENKNDDMLLAMRVSDNIMSDSDFKLFEYETRIQEKYHILGVFEDRPTVIKMWRGLNLTCYALPSMVK